MLMQGSFVALQHLVSLREPFLAPLTIILNKSTDLPDIFSDNTTDDSIDSESEPDSGDDPNDDSDDDLILDDEEGQELPAEYYLQEAECLNVSQLHQKRYSPRTQDKLDKTQKYWDQFCYNGNYDPIKHFHWFSDLEEMVCFLKALFSW
ncbi:uncharacterized protein ASPGLDRAFT_34406 [Aspergillus glaucus CBS 516.65]|uniref:Uncharacterized protein n=1 Tax=Aspergillus glaucus CBS 516.65 TaxID=1160497 RepID=A0A1L9VNX7_ASPGL|nr:hypothetical protein ASPGLDRAFT_34406 [Aspergillus glaucus CBS 516.65]OJJ85627.1 hypothetical protein ASPGLDRAFT_34406 [Aspergillus glaucus CBS 516.65]